MPPKPRPRPRPRAVAPTQNSDVLSSTQPSSPGKKNDADFFMRNRNRTKEEMEKINKRVARIEEEKHAASLSQESDDDDDSDEEERTPKAGRKKEKVLDTGKHKGLPKWAKEGAIADLLKESDSDRENTSTSSTPSKKRRRGGQDSTNETPHKRSRSRSLTPPPQLTESERLRARLAIQHVLKRTENLEAPSRPSVIEIEDDDNDDAGDQELDPALRKIAEKMRSKGQKQLSELDTNASSSSGVNHVNARVQWVNHPEDDSTGGAAPESWIFTVNANESFKQLLIQLANKAYIPVPDLVLMREGKRIFPSITPSSLGVYGRLDLEACTLSTYDAIRLRNLRSPTPAPRPDGIGIVLNREGSAAPSEASNAEDSDKFKIILRAAGTKEVSLSVRPSTTCAKIVKAFLAVLVRQGGTNLTTAKANKVRLCVDGEKQDPNAPISDCDLEDGDMVEVVGL